MIEDEELVKELHRQQPEKVITEVWETNVREIVKTMRARRSPSVEAQIRDLM